MADKKRFKLTFRSTEVHGPGGTMQRALIIAIGGSPLKGWLQAIIACEDGSMQQKVISQADFDLGEKKLVALLEVEGERAAPVIYETPAA
jgi:hypothetical protein